ncbi:lytic transglycosylase domain-containing protein [Cohnella caldifontis]|uniref:lytic transglycosylase domain-containing protein n=1 Tax=Cohnella caldifontis TaxID=3027471 RepID=UPI0023EADDDC|nr:lytic transglycosylase domain-containing protein [Cohnella sp. YIM B05605]
MSAKKKPKGKRKRWFLLVLVAVLAGLFIRSDWIGRLIYPISHAESIKLYAGQYGQDPLLIAAIIRVESNFKEDAVSRKGAVGIMQIMPDTAEWILKQEKFGDLTIEKAGSRADAGIRLGTWYVSELSRQFEGNLPVVLAAYNAGPTRVRQWLNDRVWDGKEQTVRDIPYGETRHYVQRVLYYYKKYSELYEHL